jgi:methionine synthase II (cobalamin-independent)
MPKEEEPRGELSDEEYRKALEEAVREALAARDEID